MGCLTNSTPSFEGRIVGNILRSVFFAEWPNTCLYLDIYFLELCSNMQMMEMHKDIFFPT